MKTTKKVICVLLSISMLFLCACSSKDANTSTSTSTATTNSSISTQNDYVQKTYTKKPSEISKSETVYANLTSNGKPQSIIVSDWLHTDKAEVAVKDISDAQGIVNVKGLEQPSIDGENVTWNMDSTDLYYRGYATKDLPVDMNITYSLDGETINPENLAGKDGKLQINIALKNKVLTQATINDETVNIASPFLVIGGMILGEKNFSNVLMSDGQVITDGSKSVALMVSLPGMKDTLGLGEIGLDTIGDFDFPEEFSISADVTDCNIGNMYFAIVPLSSLKIASELQDTVESLDTTLDKLSDMIDSVYQMGINDLLDTLMNNSDRITSLVGLINDASNLYQENKALLAVVQKYLTDENIASVEKLISDTKGIDLNLMAQVLTDDSVKNLVDDASRADLKKYESLLKNPLFSAFLSDLSSLLSDADAAMPLLEQLQGSMSEDQLEAILSDIDELLPMIEGLSDDMQDESVKTSVENLPQTTEKLQGIVNGIEENEDLIDELSGYLTDENMDKISSVLEDVQSTNVDAILNATQTFSQAATKSIIPRFEAMLANDYKIYSKAADNMETSVMFICQTPGISK